MPLVRPEFGPTLPQLLGPRLRALPRPAQVAVAAAAAVVVLAVVLVLVRHEEHAGQRTVVVRDPIAFNFIYRPPLVRETPTGDALARVGGDGQSFTVRALRLPPYRGDAAGFLPLYVTRLEARMQRRYPGFLSRQEGRANVNRIQGYELLFQFRRGGRLMYGRQTLLLPTATAREGVEITMLAPRTLAVPRVDAVGHNGALKTSLRSFRLGTERP